MRAVVQRVRESSVKVDGRIVGKINKGLMVLLGIDESDSLKDVEYTWDKVINLRIFEDEEGKMNRSLLDTAGEILVVSQFTLLGDCRKGRRPNFMQSAPPQKANELYEEFIKRCIESGIKTETGVFQAYMEVNIINDGPVTILVDSKKTF